MTTLEYMEKQLKKHKNNLQREMKRNAPFEVVNNISNKLGYYAEVVDILKGVKK